eukprot:COSAG01_NODE_8836_length_2643_cov_2.892689_1_plen_163_part_00
MLGQPESSSPRVRLQTEFCRRCGAAAPPAARGPARPCGQAPCATPLPRAADPGAIRAPACLYQRGHWSGYVGQKRCRYCRAVRGDTRARAEATAASAEVKMRSATVGGAQLSECVARPVLSTQRVPCIVPRPSLSLSWPRCKCYHPALRPRGLTCCQTPCAT